MDYLAKIASRNIPNLPGSPGLAHSDVLTPGQSVWETRMGLPLDPLAPQEEALVSPAPLSPELSPATPSIAAQPAAAIPPSISPPVNRLDVENSPLVKPKSLPRQEDPGAITHQEFYVDRLIERVLPSKENQNQLSPGLTPLSQTQKFTELPQVEGGEKNTPNLVPNLTPTPSSGEGKEQEKPSMEQKLPPQLLTPTMLEFHSKKPESAIPVGEPLPQLQPRTDATDWLEKAKTRTEPTLRIGQIKVELLPPAPDKKVPPPRQPNVRPQAKTTLARPSNKLIFGLGQ